VHTVSVNFDGKGVADGIVRKAGENVSTPPLLSTNESFTGITRLTGTYINYRDSRFTNSVLVADDITRLLSLENCTFDNSSLDILEKGPEFVFKTKNNTGELSITGRGESRKLTNP
jgi:hypothetical protein